MAASAPARAKKVSVDLPTKLYDEAQRVIREREINTSSFVMEAVEQYLGSLKEAKLELALREGYIANANLNRRICTEFAFVDAELH